MIPIQTNSFENAFNMMRFRFKTSSTVRTGTWQGVSTEKRPELAMRELFNVVLGLDLCSVEDLDKYRADIRPNLPWADDHFEERVGRQPLNPGKTWEYWPYAQSADTFRDSAGQFNHSYMERFWPKYADAALAKTGGKYDPQDAEWLMLNCGIRGAYGDLDDVVALLEKDPLTRQAYFPIFFPEDTGVGDGGRKPCTLGYHFILRAGRLHIVYHMRSCDYIRHLRDDCYLAVRLLLWVLNELRKRNRFWNVVTPGEYTMTMTSLHMFANDWHAIFSKEQV